MKCPVCKGEGSFKEYLDCYLSIESDCPYCKGKGHVTVFRWLNHYFWDYMPEWMFDVYIRLLRRNESEDEG